MDKHESIKRRLASLALGELPEREQAEVRAHVDRCGTCRAELTQIERLLDRAGKRKSLSADESLHESARTRLFAAIGSENKVETTARRHIRWALLGRRIVKNRMTKLAAAIIIVVAAIVLVVRSLDGTPVKAVEFSEIAKAMEEVPWMHASGSGFERGLTGVADQWIGFQSKIQAGRWADGKASFWDLHEHRRAEYDPSSNTITLTYIKDNEYPLNLASPALLLESMHKMAQDQGAQIMARMGDFQGRKVQVQEISWRNVGANKENHTATLYVDPHSKRLYAAQLSGVDAEGHVVIAGGIAFDYPETGPRDIYDLGVPRNVKIINKVADQPVQAVRRKIEEAGRRFLDEYIAVVTRAEMKEGREEIVDWFVVFRQGKKVRVDWYSYAPRRDRTVRDKLTSRYADALKASLQYLDSDDAVAEHRDLRFVRLYDGLWQYALEAEEGRLVASERQRRPDGDGFGGDEIDELGWRTLWWLNEPEHMLEDSYSHDGRLIGMELSAQALGSQPPKRLALYIDPEKDYIFQRYVEEQLIEAPWQEDKAWLDAVQDKSTLTELVRDCRVSEYARTTGGQWYPKTITETGYRCTHGAVKHDVSLTTRIHLIAEHPTFPEGVFDPDKLPK